MKTNNVKLGNIYTAKVTNRLVEVRIDAESRHGGWDATNLATGKRVRILSPQRLRAAVGATAATGGKTARGKRKAKAPAEAPPAPTSSPTIEVLPEATSAVASEPAVDEATTTIEPTTKAKRTRTPKEPKEKRMSGLDAAAKVLQERGEPMSAKEMIEAAEAAGYWKSPGGKTPHATLYSAIIREINIKGAEARFRKTDRGRFARA